jgi:hypothetical protein
MDLTEFNPLPVVAELDGNVFELRLFDLRAVTWAERYFSDTDSGGLEVLQGILNSPLDNQDDWNQYTNAIAQIVFYLNMDEDLLPPSVCLFKNQINKSSEGGSLAIAKLYTAVEKVLKLSFPDPPGETTETGSGEEKENAEPGEPVQTNWSRVYVQVSRGLKGLSIDDFYKMTMRQVKSILESIAIETRSELQNQAILHGIENYQIVSPKVNGEKKADPWTDEDKTVFAMENEKLIAELQGG